VSKRPALRPDEALGKTLSLIARGILAEAKDAITDPARNTATAVHDFRKAIKRWRSYLRFLTPHFGEGCKALQADARDAAKKLGGARDLRSTIDALEDIREEAYELNERALATISGRIKALQAEAEAKDIGANGFEAIADEVGKWSLTVSLWNFNQIEFSEVSKSLAKGYRRARNAMPDDWQEAAEEELHDYRKRVIDHRYQMELVEPLWPRMAKLWVDEAQRLRDALGMHRDLTNLRALAGPHQPLARFRSKLSPPIERRQAVHLAKAAKLSTRIFSDKPKAFRARLDALWDSGADAE
jgi:CHAD domain-containing protein